MRKYILGSYLSIVAAAAVGIIALLMFYAPLKTYTLRVEQRVRASRVWKIQTRPLLRLNREAPTLSRGVVCVPQDDGGVPVGGIGRDDVPRLPGALRLSYDDSGQSQYTSRLDGRDIFSYYLSKMNEQCWQVSSIQPHQISWTKGSDVMQIAALPQAFGGKTTVDYRAFDGVVLGVEYNAAQTSCPSDQMRCFSSSSDTVGWCQVPPCPTMSGGTAGGGGATSCTSSYSQGTINTCNWSMCPNGCNYDSQGCATSCISSGGTTGGTAGCTSQYAQSGTYSCNYSLCPSGCTWDNGGCPNGCNSAGGGGTTGGTMSCPANQMRCFSSSSDTVGWCQYPPCPTMSGGATACTGGQTRCYSSSGDTVGWCQWPPCPGSSSSSTCPAGQYWCGTTNSCLASGTSCGSWGGGAESKDSCLAGGGLWCQPSTSPHCHWGPNPSQCESDQVMASCGPGTYPCNGACIPTTQTCASPGGTTSCSSSQYSCNNVCVSWNTPCNGITPVTGGGNNYPGDANSCPGFAYSRWDSQGRRYCQLNNEVRCDSNYPSYLTNGSNYKAENCPAGTTTGGTSCGTGSYWCNGVCKPVSDTNCPMTGSQCGTGYFWCPARNVCIRNTETCETGGQTGGQTTPPQTQVQCGQCQTSSNGQCVNVPEGTPDSRCGTNGVCDKNGGCITLKPGQKVVGRGAICGNSWCEPEKGENRENCRIECDNAPEVAPTPSRGNEGQFPGQGRGNEGQFPGQGQGNEGQFPGGPGGPGDQGRFEQERQKIDEERFQRMKKEFSGFERMIKEMQKFSTKIERSLKSKRCTEVSVPAEFKNAIQKAPELLASIKNAKSAEEIDEIIPDLMDIGDSMREMGNTMGELMGLCEMLKRSTSDIRNIDRAVKRVAAYVKKNPVLEESVNELKAIAEAMKQGIQKAKELAKTDPQEAFGTIQSEFYDRMEEFWNLVGEIDMVVNLSKGINQAASEIKRAEQKVKALSKNKKVDQEVVAQLNDIVQQLKEDLNELRALQKQKGSVEDIKALAEEMWQKFMEYENLLAEIGQSSYGPKIAPTETIEFRPPDAFEFGPPEGGFGGGNFGMPGGPVEGGGGFGGPSSGQSGTSGPSGGPSGVLGPGF